MSFLAAAGTLLASSSLDYEATLAALTRLVVPRLADWCALEIVNDDGTTRQLGVAHVDPAKVRYAEELRQRYPPRPEDRHGALEVIRTGKPEFLPDIPDELLVAGARDEEHLRIARELGLRSAMICRSPPGGARWGRSRSSPPSPTGASPPDDFASPSSSPPAPPWRWTMPGSTARRCTPRSASARSSPPPPRRCG